MKILLSLLAALAVATPTLAAPARRPAAAAHNWLNTIVATPEGGFRIGNPAAKVKLVEYGSLTCPHCRAFYQSAMADLRAKYIATGNVSFEYRNFVRNGPDYAASLLAACDGPAKFFDRIDALFNNQDKWMDPFVTMKAEAAEKIGALPPEAQIAALAKAGSLDTFMQKRGLTPARATQCLGNKAAQDALTNVQRTAIETYKVDGTPGFLIDGQRQTVDVAGVTRGVVTWIDLEPKIVAALR
ncbi:thioredoxin domain-containing protein [Glacieibacterium sp.]|uniref:thioredoxin domain-containing protein n=1 Tax=Glacieibacterium sp. TaxID=2860237 RepID=UPI003AFF76CB